MLLTGVSNLNNNKIPMNKMTAIKAAGAGMHQTHDVVSFSGANKVVLRAGDAVVIAINNNDLLVLVKKIGNKIEQTVENIKTGKLIRKYFKSFISKYRTIEKFDATTNNRIELAERDFNGRSSVLKWDAVTRNLIEDAVENPDKSSVVEKFDATTKEIIGRAIREADGSGKILTLNPETGKFEETIIPPYAKK